VPLHVFWAASIVVAATTMQTLHAQDVVVVQEGPGKVVVLSAGHPSQRTSIAVGARPHEIEIAPKARIAFVSNFGLLEANHQMGTPGTSISVLDLDRLVESKRFTLPSGLTAPHGLKLRPPKYRELFTNTEIGTESMVVFDASSGAVLRTFTLPIGVHNFIFNADGSSLYAFTLKGEVCRIDPDTGKVIASVQTGSPRGLAWTNDHRELIVSGKNEILFLDPATLAIKRRAGDLGVGQIFYPSMTPDGKYILAPAVLDSVVVVIDAHTGKVIQRVDTGSPLLLMFTPDGRHAVTSNVLVPAGLFGPQTKARDGGVVIIDLATFETTKIADLTDTNGLAITLHR
jgi:DNA-binding beta-propeller fold protein YncE